MNRLLSVAYFDLGYSKEQYGLYATKYGGGSVLAKYLKEDPDIDFVIFAPKESFDNVGDGERKDRCIVMGSELCDALRQGYPISELFGDGKPYRLPDIILHPHTCATVNKGTLNLPVVHFCGFDGKAGHSWNDYVLLYDSSFTPQFGERAKYVKIGKPVPATFQSSVRDSYVFQCSRHDDHQNTIEVAKACLATGIRGIFAGPIHNGYPLMEHIDGKTTIYVGEISEENKLDFCRHATLFTLLANWDLPFSQSIIEAQGQGTPIWVNKRGPFLETYLKHGVNGFDAALFGLDEAFHSARTIDYQKECWEAASVYSVPVMVSSFKKAFKEIVEEWKGPSWIILKNVV